MTALHVATLIGMLMTPLHVSTLIGMIMTPLRVATLTGLFFMHVNVAPPKISSIEEHSGIIIIYTHNHSHMYFSVVTVSA